MKIVSGTNVYLYMRRTKLINKDLCDNLYLGRKFIKNCFLVWFSWSVGRILSSTSDLNLSRPKLEFGSSYEKFDVWSRPSSDSIYFHNVQYSTMFTSGSKLWLFIHLARYMKSPTFETKSLHSQNSYVGYGNVIHGLAKIRYVGLEWFKRRCFHVLIEGVRLGTWKVRRFNSAWVGIIGLKI